MRKFFFYIVHSIKIDLYYTVDCTALPLCPILNNSKFRSALKQAMLTHVIPNK